MSENVQPPSDILYSYSCSVQDRLEFGWHPVDRCTKAWVDGKLVWQEGDQRGVAEAIRGGVNRPGTVTR